MNSGWPDRVSTPFQSQPPLKAYSKMPWQLFNRRDLEKLTNDWNARSQDLFVKKVVDDWVSLMMDKLITRDIHSQMADAVQFARTPQDLWVSAGLCFDPDHRFWVGKRSMTIKQLIYRTNALQRLASDIGDKIKVRPLYDDGVIFFKIEFWPNL